jgi:hypothetical protein
LYEIERKSPQNKINYRISSDFDHRESLYCILKLITVELLLSLFGKPVNELGKPYNLLRELLAIYRVPINS